MSTARTDAISRRTALAGLGAGGLGVALAATARAAAAQDVEMANHPMVGAWLVGRAPNDITVAHFGADGLVSTNTPTVGVGADGAVTHSDSAMGSWVPEGARGIHFVFTNRTYDAAGALTGYFTVETHPVVSEDGMSFWDDAADLTVTIRDPNGAVVQSFGGDGGIPPVGGVRLVPGASGYDEMLAMLAARTTATPEAGTPTA